MNRESHFEGIALPDCRFRISTKCGYLLETREKKQDLGTFKKTGLKLDSLIKNSNEIDHMSQSQQSVEESMGVSTHKITGLV